MLNLQLNDAISVYQTTLEEPDFCVSGYDFGTIHYLNVILLHFSILSICHCSWVVMEDQRSVNCTCL